METKININAHLTATERKKLEREPKEEETYESLVKDLIQFKTERFLNIVVIEGDYIFDGENENYIETVERYHTKKVKDILYKMEKVIERENRSPMKDVRCEFNKSITGE